MRDSVRRKSRDVSPRYLPNRTAQKTQSFSQIRFKIFGLWDLPLLVYEYRPIWCGEDPSAFPELSTSWVSFRISGQHIGSVRISVSVEGGYNSGAIRLPFVFYDAVPAASYQKISVGLGILIVSANRLVYIKFLNDFGDFFIHRAIPSR